MAPADRVGSYGSLISRVLNRVEYRLAETEADKEAIYRLRYAAYLKEGAIHPNPDGLVTDRFDDLPNSWTFGVYAGGELASSIRISVCAGSHPETPSMDVFPDLLEPRVAQGKILVDPTRFVANSVLARSLPELPYLTVRLAYIACNYFNADIGLATVRAEHQAFYRRVFLHEPLTGPRTYPGLIKPICLMAVDFPNMWERVLQRYPFLHASDHEQRVLFERGGVQSPALNGSDMTPSSLIAKAEAAG